MELITVRVHGSGLGLGSEQPCRTWHLPTAPQAGRSPGFRTQLSHCVHACPATHGTGEPYLSYDVAWIPPGEVYPAADPAGPLSALLDVFNAVPAAASDAPATHLAQQVPSTRLQVRSRLPELVARHRSGSVALHCTLPYLQSHTHANVSTVSFCVLSLPQHAMRSPMTSTSTFKHMLPASHQTHPSGTPRPLHAREAMRCSRCGSSPARWRKGRPFRGSQCGSARRG